MVPPHSAVPPEVSVRQRPGWLPKAAVTQKHVADLAGVSFITVSRVINNVGNVKPETRARVEAAIRELRYHLNRQAQALNNGLTHTLALVTPRMSDRLLFHNFYIMSLVAGVEVRGRELGWDVLLTTDYDQEGDFDFLRVWHQRKVDGLVCIGLKNIPPDQILEIEQQQIPCVSVSDRILSPAISWVDTQNDEAATDAVQRLAALGHRRFAYLGVGDHVYNPNFRDRERAVRRTVAELGLDLDVFEWRVGTSGPGSLEYVDRSPRATAIIAGNDSAALDFIARVAKVGLTCPRDYSIVGFDAEPAGRSSSPVLASYRQPLVEMGGEAVGLLVGAITGRRQTKAEVTFGLEFLPGETLAPPPAL